MNTKMSAVGLLADTLRCTACGWELVYAKPTAEKIISRSPITLHCCNLGCERRGKIFRIPMPFVEIEGIWSGEEYT